MIKSNLSKARCAITAALSLMLSEAAFAGSATVTAVNTPGTLLVDTSKTNVVGVDTTDPKKPAVVLGRTEWGGFGWGLGVAANFDVGGSRVVSATTINNIVRIEDASSNVNIGFVLEAHYFLRTYDFLDRPKMPKVDDCHAVALNLFCSEIAHGPFVAIQVGGGTASPLGTTSSASNPITAYALGWMVGLRHPNFTTSANSSWNLGLGVRVDPNAKVLGDGIVANKVLPDGEVANPVRLKQSPRVGMMLVSSFSF
jgi:hypothetical protein